VRLAKKVSLHANTLSRNYILTPLSLKQSKKESSAILIKQSMSFLLIPILSFLIYIIVFCTQTNTRLDGSSLLRDFLQKSGNMFSTHTTLTLNLIIESIMLIGGSHVSYTTCTSFVLISGTSGTWRYMVVTQMIKDKLFKHDYSERSICYTIKIDHNYLLLINNFLTCLSHAELSKAIIS
jgi:hypothetical protein